MATAERLKPVRVAAAAAVLALLAVTCQGRAIALEADSVQSRTNDISPEAPTPIYFGNGCFWGRQKDYIDAEKSMGRPKSDLSAVVGYAGGKQKGITLTAQLLSYKSCPTHYLLNFTCCTRSDIALQRCSFGI